MRRFAIAMLCIPIVYLCFFAVLLWYLWPRLDNAATAAIVGVLGGGIAGVMGSALASWIGVWQADKESEDRLKSYASAQALELTKLDFDKRREAKAQLGEQAVGFRMFLAPVKVYRTFYYALLELYTKGTWPEEPEKLGLLQILAYDLEEGGGQAEAQSSGE